jgi:5-formyltetrahydrofolate cyclo-ligase
MIEGREGGNPRQHVDSLVIDSAKALLRKAITLRRDLRSPTLRKADDASRFDLMRRQLSGRTPSKVAAYLSMGSEPGTLQLVAWLAAQGAEVLLPVLTRPGHGPHGEAAWAPYAGPDALRVGVMSILEPTTATRTGDALGSAELVICPALAANTAGDRLGRGGGWYDRALQHASEGSQLWALLNDDEVLEAIPTQEWDLRIGAIVTPSWIIDCRPRPVG